MSEAESRVDIIRLPSTFAEQGTKIKTMRQQFKDVQHAGELDAATKNLGFPAFLLNFYLATSVNLSPIGLEADVHIPVQITEREGGRKSLYDLAQGEEVLAGIYVTSQGIALRYVKRETGSDVPAKPGDIYSTRITTREEKLIFEGQAVLRKFDPLTGIGHFVPAPSPGAVTRDGEGSLVSFFWSSVVYQPDHWVDL